MKLNTKSTYLNITGLITGVIIRIDTNNLSASTVAKIGSLCEEQYQESQCGRVLGMTFTKSGKLLVCDAVFGLYMIDLDKRTEANRITDTKYDDSVEYTALLTPDTLVNGTQNLVFNSVVLADDDVTVYVTVSSTMFPLQDALWEAASSPSGRVLKFNIVTKQVDIIMNSLSFANGIEMSPGEEYLIVCESGRAKLHKYFLKGEKAGKSEIFLDSLPGLPDNIK